MGENNLNKQRQTKFEEALEEILNENIDIQSQGKDVDRLLDKDSDFDKTNEMLLKYYNERTESDFQKELKAQLNLDVYKKMQGKLDSIDKEIKKNEREEQIRDMSKEALKGEKVDADIEKQAIKKAEKSLDSDSEVDLKAEIMIAVYEEAFDRYSSLLEKYKKNQLRDDSMTIGDKEGTELVLYEKYLKNLEKNYAGYAKSKNLEVKSLTADDSIKAKREKLEYDMKKMTRSNDLAIEDNIQRIRILADRRNAIAEKMSEISQNRNNMSQEQFKRSMDYYQQQYFEVTVELRSQDPTLEQYQNQIEQENENIDYSNRTIGARNDSIVAGSYQELDSYGHIKEDLGDENLEEIADITQDYANTSQEVVGDMIKEAKLALMNGDIQKATEIIESAEGLSFGREVSKRDSDENAISENDEQLKEGMEQNDEQNEYSNNSFMQEMESGVADEKEAQLQERLRILEENYNKDIEDAQIEQNNLDKTMVRTRFNKKTN